MSDGAESWAWGMWEGRWLGVGKSVVLYVVWFLCVVVLIFFFSSRRRHTRFDCDWSSDVCSSDLARHGQHHARGQVPGFSGGLMGLVTQSEMDSYELELSGLSAAELKALKARYE